MRIPLSWTSVWVWRGLAGLGLSEEFQAGRMHGGVDGGLRSAYLSPSCLVVHASVFAVNQLVCKVLMFRAGANQSNPGWLVKVLFPRRAGGSASVHLATGRVSKL